MSIKKHALKSISRVNRFLIGISIENGHSRSHDFLSTSTKHPLLCTNYEKIKFSSQLFCKAILYSSSEQMLSKREKKLDISVHT